MASLTQWTWVWVNSGSWRWTGRPGMLQSMGSQRVGHEGVAELTDWLVLKMYCLCAVLLHLSLCPWWNWCTYGHLNKACSVQFSCSVIANSWLPCELQHARPPCPSPIPGASPNSYPFIGDAIQPSHPLSSPSPPTFSLSQHQGLLKWVSSLHQVARVLGFNFNISPSNEPPGLISFRMDWLDLLAVQGTLKSLLQHHSSQASILPRSAFFIVQLSHPYMTTWKNIAFTRWTFVGKVMSLLFAF